MEHLNSRLRHALIVVGIVGMTVIGCRHSQSRQQVAEQPENEAAAETGAANTPRTVASVDDAEIDNLRTADQAASPQSGLASDASPPIDEQDEKKTIQPAPARWLVHSNHTVLVIDVTSSWNDQTQSQCSTENLQQITQLCDANQDGTTTWDELSSFGDLLPRPSGADALPLEFLSTYDANGDDTVDSPELRQFLARGRLVIDGWLAIRIERHFTGQLDSPTLRWLDEDGNGYLDSSEIDNASHRLSGTDADDDRLIWAADLAPLDTISRFVPSQTPMTLTNVRQHVCRIDESTDWPQLAFDLERRFSFGAPLAVSDLPCDSALARLDPQHGVGDDEISIDELQQLTTIEPDLSIHLSWRPPNLFLAADEGPQQPTRLVTATGGIAIELSMQPPPSAPPEFNSLDINDDLSIDRQEFASRVGPSPLTFEAVDRDNKGGVDEAEYHSAMTLDHLIHGAFVNARIFRGLDPLFALFDQNHDGRLDRRETNAAKQQLSELTDNGKRCIDSSDLAASVAVDFSTGLGTGSVPLPPRAPVPVRPNPDRPAWFVEMDFDNSGELDTDEFLGPTVTFETLDTNQDGYIELQEIADE